MALFGARMEVLGVEVGVLTLLMQAMIPFPELMRHPRRQQDHPHTPHLIYFFQAPTAIQIRSPPHPLPCAMAH